MDAKIPYPLCITNKITERGSKIVDLLFKYDKSKSPWKNQLALLRLQHIYEVKPRQDFMVSFAKNYIETQNNAK